VRRFTAFADKYLEGDLKKTEYCLKDAFLLHKWEKIKRSYTQVNFSGELSEKKFTDVDTLGAAACASGSCEIDF
jgi:hypothetical protein